jgi:hypothetical protein
MKMQLLRVHSNVLNMGNLKTKGDVGFQPFLARHFEGFEIAR